MRKIFKGDILEFYLSEGESININLKEQITIDGITQINVWLSFHIEEDNSEEKYWLSGAIDEKGNEVIPISLRTADELDSKDEPDIVLYPGKKALLRKVNGYDYLISLENQSFSMFYGRPIPNEYIIKARAIGKLDNSLISCVMDINTLFLYDVINNVKVTPDINAFQLIQNKEGKMKYELIIKPEEKEYYKDFYIFLYYDVNTRSIDSNLVIALTSPLKLRLDAILPDNAKTRKQICDYCNECIDSSVENNYIDSLKGGIYLN